MTAFRADVIAVDSMAAAQLSGGGSNYLVEVNSGALYLVFIDGQTDVVFKKSTDGGLTWTSPVAILTGTGTQLSVWYDRWSGIAAGLIHCAYTDSADGDTKYRSIDTENSDTLSTQTVIFAGTSAAGSCCLSISRARGGNLYCHTMIDAGAEGGFFRSVDAGANWTSRTLNEALAAGDMIILVPGWAADNQDMMAFFWDVGSNEISRQLYDDSGDAWAETSIAASMVDIPAANSFPQFAATVDITNSRNLLVAWSGVDTANADLRCWHVTESAITEVTNVVLNSADDQGLCAIGIDTVTQDWYVIYGGESDGSETWQTSVNFYYKVSTDDGANWGSETVLTTQFYSVGWLAMPPRFTAPLSAAWRAGTIGYVSIQADDGAGGGGGGGPLIGSRLAA